MITPPPGLSLPRRDAQKPQADTPADAAPAEQEAFITPPPGTFDSGTYRMTNPRIVPPRTQKASDDIVFFPTGAGAPVPAAQRQAASQWRLVLPDGIGAKAVDGALFIGRNPTRTAERQDAELLPLIDPAKSLSKTHALLEVEDGVLWVHDLDSTNGVFIVPQSGDMVEVEPGTRAVVPTDSDLELGNYVIHVERH
jgi:hypothetical protein